MAREGLQKMWYKIGQLYSGPHPAHPQRSGMGRDGRAQFTSLQLLKPNLIELIAIEGRTRGTS